MVDEDQIEWAHCNKCGQETKHEVLLRRKQPGEEVANPYDHQPPMTISWSTDWTVLECRGCETVTLKRLFWFSEWDRGDEQVDYFPPRLARKLPQWTESLDEPISELLEEVYAALQSGSRRLAVMGARAVLDLFMVDKVGDIGGFAVKLEKLQEKGFVSKRDQETLDAALDAGNAAAHRGHAPTSEHLNHVIDIVENLLQSDRLAGLAEAIRESTPKRGESSKKDDD